MDLPEAVSLRKFRDFSKQQKEELFETLLELSEAIEELPKKSLRKTLQLTLAVLEFKGQQVRDLEEQLQAKDKDSSESPQHERVLDENEKLKSMVANLEDEKIEYKNKAKELTEEIFSLQKRLQDAANADVSDKDSSDPLSELDKQESLLRNISSKNKHIKRLLKEIESLQTQNIEQSKMILILENDLKHAKDIILQLKADKTLLESEKIALKESAQDLNIEIKRLEGNITYLEDEREKNENDLKEFIEKLEMKAVSWKRMLEEKDKQLKKFKSKKEVKQDTRDEQQETENKTESEQSDEQEEISRLQQCLESRDNLIEQLESKIKLMAEEMIASTKLMNRLTAEKEEERNPRKLRPCCKTVESALKASNEKCKELSEMLQKTEEESSLKAKQAMEAVKALTAYQKGEDGLMCTLRKCSSLENKLQSRDKQIRALVMELNSMHEIAQENNLLRKRLHIPDDVIITAKNLQAKERSKEKMIEKLTLKLRASEEIRLQLQLEKSDLRKQLMELKPDINATKPAEEQVIEAQKSPMKISKTAVPKETKNHHLKSPSSTIKEVGEVEDSSNSRETSLLVTACSQCQGNLRIEFQDSNDIGLQANFQEIQQENDILRQGMLEILEKLREYDDCSDNIIINNELVIRLIAALKNSNSPFDTPKRIREQLALIKSREQALEQLLLKQKLHSEEREIATEDLNSIESVREDGEIKDIIETDLQLPEFLDTSTRPTTPNKSIDVPSISQQTDSPEVQTNQKQPQKSLPQQRKEEMELEELKIFKKYYEELKLHMNANEMEIMQACAQLTEQVVKQELELIRERKSYEYMREDFDKNLSALKQIEIENFTMKAQLRKELLEKQESLEKLKQDFRIYKNLYNYTSDDYNNLQQSLNESQMKLALITEELLAGKREEGVTKIPELCMDYGIITEDLQVEFITQQEYEAQKQMSTEFEAQKQEMQRKNTQLESLLEIAQEQIMSQQRLLNDITDNHVNLRHLVADLQSSTEEKLLMAKMQRDLDAAKLELNHIRNERDAVKLQFESVQQDLTGRNHLIDNLNKTFQLESQNSAIKIKFLQKSICCLKEKYAKFTPLVFLSNFVYAYNKFLQKKSNATEANINKSEFLNDYIEDVIKTGLKEFNLEMEENQKVIKMIKTETQCKLYEDQLKQWEKKYYDLEKDLSELKLKMAGESEHWHTIEALFGGGKHLEAQEKSSDKTGNSHPVQQLTKEIGCNTVNIPIPAERSISNVQAQKVSKQMVDKNVSPILSPTKKALNEISTQTENGLNVFQSISDLEIKSGSHEVEEKGRLSKPESKQSKSDDTCRQTSEAQIQTSSDLLAQHSKAIQTLDEEIKDKRDNEKTVKEEEHEEALEKLCRTEESLQQAKLKITELEQKLTTLSKASSNTELQEKPRTPPQQHVQTSTLQTDVIEKTILSFHTLLTEKDKSIGKYQDILQTEREQNQSNLNEMNNEIEGFKSTIANLNFNIKTKDIEILELKTQLEASSVRRNSNEKLELATHLQPAGEENIDNSLNEMTDEKIEEMFIENLTPSSKETASGERENAVKEKHELEHNTDMPENLSKQLKELKEKSGYWESSFKLKEEEVQVLKEKIKILQDREKSTNITLNPEIEPLRSLLDEKDKHINELMDTLNNFHDDQRRYINDSSNYSADQIAKLANDLTRTEATNKIYHTQVEALRKQITNLTQREKQARELNQSLRNQLIKRPVVSIKTELNARVKNESLQKRIQQLELDLEDAKAEIQRQRVIIDSKRARSANEVGLWEKQKRWQQSAEKFKSKLEETETLLEKTRSLLQSARNTINRLEKDKQILEAKFNRITQHNIQHSMKCCRTPSCPNLHHQSSVVGSGSGPGAKYTPSESPETYTGISSESSSPGRSSVINCNKARYNHAASSLQNPHNDIIEALKARIEMQQRKILSLELEGKGSDTLTNEMGKIQEKLSSVEAQNIRLEAKNLQLQLDNDLLRQGDGTERLQKRIKHLEDYIIALKEEMASVEARKELCKCSGIKLNTQLGQSAETTILSLRNLVEKLKAENKYLKDGRRSCESRASTELCNKDTARLQQMYTDSISKISALQLELKLKSKCPHCENKDRMMSLDTQTQDELKYVKEQLIKKSQLLQKAKVLLTRAAAKEKVLKEQLSIWKRKCSELQNVPVIDEISE